MKISAYKNMKYPNGQTARNIIRMILQTSHILLLELFSAKTCSLEDLNLTKAQKIFYKICLTKKMKAIALFSIAKKMLK